MDVHWNEGAKDCAASPLDPIQVHRYEPQTFILRVNLCEHFEGNFIYLLVGAKRALLIDTGPIADSKVMPLARTVLGLLPSENNSVIPLLVVHTHEHQDHRAGDPQFESLPSVQLVSSDFEKMRTFFGFNTWPDGIAHIDLGDRIVEVIPTPGHTSAHIAFYDNRTGLLLSGDFLLPGRLTIEDTHAYRASAKRVARFVKTHPVRYVVGSHIELDAAGRLYDDGSQYHPNERPLQLTQDDVLALPVALDRFNGFYAQYPNFVLTHPIHNLLALVLAAATVLLIIVLLVRQYFGRRRRSKSELAT
jgi:glyoxylase-like metal-dependent hydrolase (beta-lactamase superfamily II)